MAQHTNDMTDGEILVSIMAENGVDITDDERTCVVRSINSSIKKGCVEFIKKNGRVIGWVTYEPVENIFLNYCFIYPRYRHNVSLLGLRSIFRKSNKRFGWYSRRRGNRKVNVV